MNITWKLESINLESTFVNGIYKLGIHKSRIDTFGTKQTNS